MQGRCFGLRESESNALSGRSDLRRFAQNANGVGSEVVPQLASDRRADVRGFLQVANHGFLAVRNGAGERRKLKLRRNDLLIEAAIEVGVLGNAAVETILAAALQFGVDQLAWKAAFIVLAVVDRRSVGLAGKLKLTTHPQALVDWSRFDDLAAVNRPRVAARARFFSDVLRGDFDEGRWHWLAEVDAADCGGGGHGRKASKRSTEKRAAATADS